jgi:hypothetical protein
MDVEYHEVSLKSQSMLGLLDRMHTYLYMHTNDTRVIKP